MNNFEEKSIGGFNVKVSKLPAFKGAVVLNALTKLLGPSLEKAGDSFSNLDSINLAKLAGAFGDLLSRVEEKDLKFFIDNLLQNATLNNAPFLSTYDLVLMGKVDVLFECLVFAIDTNYRNFIERLQTKIRETRLLQSLSKETKRNTQ